MRSTPIQQELPDHVIWLVAGEDSRYVRRYEFKPFSLGEVATFYNFEEDGSLDYDTAVTCRIESDPDLGMIARMV